MGFFKGQMYIEWLLGKGKIMQWQWYILVVEEAFNYLSTL